MKTGESTSVLYPRVKQVKGNNLSTGAQIAIARHYRGGCHRAYLRQIGLETLLATQEL